MTLLMCCRGNQPQPTAAIKGRDVLLPFRSQGCYLPYVNKPNSNFVLQFSLCTRYHFFVKLRIMIDLPCLVCVIDQGTAGGWVEVKLLSQRSNQQKKLGCFYIPPELSLSSVLCFSFFFRNWRIGFWCQTVCSALFRY